VARVALPRLNEFADDVQALAIEMLDSQIKFRGDNGADVMAVSFATKQAEHLASLRTLVSAGAHRDALVIARMMIEGLVRLHWAFQEAERTELWLWFGAILDWQQTRKNERVGISVDPDETAELWTYVEHHGPNYFKDKVRKLYAAAERDGIAFDLPDDPWDHKWTDTTIKQMFEEVHAKHWYDGVYGDASEWSHWGVRSILRAMEPDGKALVGFTKDDWRSATIALQLGCQSLLQTLQLADDHFSLGKAERIQGLLDTMATIMDESLGSMA
jgi:hypothetical protein